MKPPFSYGFPMVFPWFSHSPPTALVSSGAGSGAAGSAGGGGASAKVPLRMARRWAGPQGSRLRYAQVSYIMYIYIYLIYIYMYIYIYIYCIWISLITRLAVRGSAVPGPKKGQEMMVQNPADAEVKKALVRTERPKNLTFG